MRWPCLENLVGVLGVAETGQGEGAHRRAEVIHFRQLRWLWTFSFG